PSIPPRSFFAQNVTIRPRSAAASTWAKLPSSTTSGSGRTSCRTTHSSSPSPTSRFEPPPRNLCGTPRESSTFRRSGIASCFLIRSRSVVPPMPKEVRSASAEPGRNSTPSSGSASTILGSSMRMVGWVLRADQHHELVAGAADVARPNREDGTSRAGLAQQELDAFLHRMDIGDILVSSLANRIRERLAGDSGNWSFASGVNVGQNEYICEVEGPAEIVPKMLRARVAVRLEQHERAVESAILGGFQCCTNLGGMMAVIVNHGAFVNYALDVEAAAHSGKLRQTFADQIGRNI